MAMNQEQTIIADLYAKYEQKRKEMKAMDFDDLLLEANRLLKTSKVVREKWQNRLDYIHVDEFQDVDYIQYEIVRMLCGPHCKLCVVGDPATNLTRVNVPLRYTETLLYNTFAIIKNTLLLLYNSFISIQFFYV